jgi:hypothetical protein
MTDHRYTLEDLEAYGLEPRALPVEQQDVLRDLTAEELALLVEIRSRLDEVGPEVQAHGEFAGAALF